MSRELLLDAASRGVRYVGGIDARSVAASPEAIACLAELDEPLPEAPASPECVLEMLDRIGSPATTATTGRRFFGFVIGGALPVTVAANWLAGAWDQPAGLVTVSPVGAALEDVSLRWLVDLLGLPEGTGGAFVTGATMANFTALAAARNAVFERAGWDVEADGLQGAPQITVVTGEEAHPSVLKSLGMLGLGRKRAVTVPVDRQGRMRANVLPALNERTIVCVQVGNVNTGACDPIAEVCALAHERGAWVHVDGAFGLWAAASSKLAHLVSGVEQADSWATDAHKWLNVPYDSGVAFVRSTEHLQRAMSLTAAYLPQGAQREPSQYTPELSRRARGVEIWAALKTLGRTGVAHMIERNCRQAAMFAERLQRAGCEILNDVVLNQVLVSFGDPDVTRRTIGLIQRDGACWCGETTWQGRVAMRISVCSWATADEDVERSLEAMLRCWDEARR
ncbi:MAG TPA: aminotransferase class V-fold PLP-dependent enzyme [Bryobacteraceae bacterium]|nr:aminotransferase class V-fold PLP-dependent enzyme [Bryobacteraceae bacterium]